MSAAGSNPAPSAEGCCAWANMWGMADDLVFSAPWRDLRTADPRQQAEAERLAHELAAELNDGHQLYGEPTRVIATSDERDDIMITRPDGFAIVHLTWRGEAERNPWPLVVYYHSVAAAQAAVDDDR